MNSVYNFNNLIVEKHLEKLADGGFISKDYGIL